MIIERIVTGCNDCPFKRTSNSMDHITDRECHLDESNMRMTYYGSGDLFKDCELKDTNIVVKLRINRSVK